MRRITFLLIALIFLFVGCAQADKKPEVKPDTKPQTIVVPEVSSIPFDMVELEDAPDVVKKVAIAMEDKEFFNWITDNGNGYIIIMPNGDKQSNHIKIDRIEQRVPSENYAWLNVKLKYSPKETSNADKELLANKPVIARFDLKNTPNAVGFQLERPEMASTVQQQPQPQPQPAKPEPKPVKNTTNSQQNQPEQEDDSDLAKGPAIRIINPMPGDAVSSPLAISGNVGFLSGNVHVRIVNASGKVISEKPVEIKEKTFETSVSFPSPANQEQGMVEAFLINPQDNSEVSRISIYVTLLPAQ